MDTLIATYGSDSDTDSDLPVKQEVAASPSLSLPPPPVDLLTPTNSLGSIDYLQNNSRIRSFPHVQGNYAVHVFIPVYIPSAAKRGLAQILKKLVSAVPDLNVVDVDVPLNMLCKDDQKLEQIVLGREFHISLGRTVPIRVHQIDSMVSMLRQRLQLQKRYCIEFSNLEIFVNDDRTRTFVSLEITMAGLPEIKKQISAVNEVYKMHSLPEFYKDPRPHISLAWTLGDVSMSLKRVVEYETRRNLPAGGSMGKTIFRCKFEGIECRIGKKSYTICKCVDEL